MPPLHRLHVLRGESWVERGRHGGGVGRSRVGGRRRHEGHVLQPLRSLELVGRARVGDQVPRGRGQRREERGTVLRPEPGGEGRGERGQRGQEELR